MQAKVLLDVSVVCFSSHILNSTATLVSILSSGGEFPKVIVRRGFWDDVLAMLEKSAFSSEPRQGGCGFATGSLERVWSLVPTLSGVLPQWRSSRTNPRAHGLRAWYSPWHVATMLFHEHVHVCVFLHVTCRRLKRVRIIIKKKK